MNKSTLRKPTGLVVLVLLASIFVFISPAQTAPTPAHLTERGTLESLGPMVVGLQPVFDNVGQGLQSQAPQVAAAIRDAGGPEAQQQTNRVADIVQDVVSGAGRTVVDTPDMTSHELKAVPI